MKIRYRFWLGLVVMVVLFVSFGVYAVFSAHHALVEAKEAELVGLAAALSDSIEYRIHEQVHFLEFLELNDFAVVRELGEANRVGPERDPFRRQLLEREWQGGGEVERIAGGSVLSRRLAGLARFLEESQGFPVFTELFVTDVHGRVVGMIGGTTDYFQDDEVWWADVMRFGLVGDVLEFDESSGSYGLVVGVRLDDESGRPIGVVKGVLNVGGIVRRVQEDKLGSGVELLLFERDGRFLFSSVSGFASQGEVRGGSELMQYVSGEKGFFEVPGRDGLPYVAYHGMSSEEKSGRWFSWVFMVRQGGDVLFERVNQLVRSAVLFLVLVVGLVLVLGVFVSRKLTAPIEQLALVLEKASTGVGSLEIPQELKDGDDEIGRLARSFDRMLYSIRMAVRKHPPKKDVD